MSLARDGIDPTKPVAEAARVATSGVMSADPSELPSVDLGYEAHKAAIAALHACESAMFDGDEGEVADSPDPLYCGCSDCQVRVTLNAAFDYLVEAAARGEMLTLTPCPDAPPEGLQA